VIGLLILLCAPGAFYYSTLSEFERVKLFWRYGTPEMQANVIMSLTKHLYVGMSKDQVWGLLAPNAHITHSPNPEPGEESYSFNIRAGWNTGIDVTFKDGRLLSYDAYD
jgi:hypothetical protein